MSDVINGFIKAQKEDKMVHVNGSEANLSEETPIVKTKRFTYSKVLLFIFYFFYPISIALRSKERNLIFWFK